MPMYSRKTNMVTDSDTHADTNTGHDIFEKDKNTDTTKTHEKNINMYVFFIINIITLLKYPKKALKCMDSCLFIPLRRTSLVSNMHLPSSLSICKKLKRRKIIYNRSWIRIYCAPNIEPNKTYTYKKKKY